MMMVETGRCEVRKIMIHSINVTTGFIAQPLAAGVEEQNDNLLSFLEMILTSIENL